MSQHAMSGTPLKDPRSGVSLMRAARREVRMQRGMTVDDAVEVVNVLGDLLAQDAGDDVRELVMAARRLVRGVDELSCELERERARRQTSSTAYVHTDGHPLEQGCDGGGRRDFLAGRAVHAG